MKWQTYSKKSADQLEALASNWARQGMPLRRVKTARHSIEAGKQLLMLKEITPHGEFQNMVDRLGISARSSSRYMAMARRFLDAPGSFFDAVGSAWKLQALMPLDDAEALAKGEEVHGLTLGRVAQMTVKELRAAVRAAVEKERGERWMTGDAAASLARIAAAAQFMDSNAASTPPLPKRAEPKVRLTVEEERMLRRYRKCNAEGRAALLQVAGLLVQAPAP